LVRYKVDIAALSETRLSEQGQLEEVGAGYTFIWSGRPKAELRDAGVYRRVAAPSPLHLPQHGVDAGDSGPLQDFHVRDPLLPCQLRYSAEAAEMEVIQLPGLVREDGPGLRSVKECRQDDGFVHLQFGVQVNTVAIPQGDLQPADGLSGFGDPSGNLIIDSRVA
uniref:Uncharacterized protein n=1 Tax=Schistocephalus solidus TaxID=70667 RepID=A0A183TET3_SCHSO